MTLRRVVIISLGVRHTMALLKQGQDNLHVPDIPPEATRGTLSVQNNYEVKFFAHMDKTASISVHMAFARFCEDTLVHNPFFCAPHVCNDGDKKKWQVCHATDAALDNPKLMAEKAVADAKGKPILLGTVVRNPFSQMVSKFFQDVDHGCCGQSGVRERLRAGSLTLSELQTHFEATTVKTWFKWPSDNPYSKWIGTFYGIAGIEREAYTFDVEARRAVVHNPENNVTFIVLRMEDIEDWATLASDYVPELTMLTHMNDGEAKWYADIYKAFVQSYTFPSSVCDQVTSTEAWAHYSKTEQDCILALSCSRASRSALLWQGSKVYANCGGRRNLLLHDTLVGDLDPDDPDGLE